MRLLAVALFVLALSGSALAQSLTGEWFKATATAKGASFEFGGIDPGGDLIATKASFKKITHYVQLFEDEGFGSEFYSAVIWVQDVEGNWFPFDSGQILFGDTDRTYVIFSELTFYVSESLVGDDQQEGGGGLQGFDVEFNGPSKIKFKGEELKSAKIKSDGAVADGSFTGDGPFVGSAKVSLTRVDESKLPFEVMMKGQPGDELPVAQPSWRAQQGETVGPQQPATQQG